MENYQEQMKNWGFEKLKSSSLLEGLLVDYKHISWDDLRAGNGFLHIGHSRFNRIARWMQHLQKMWPQIVETGLRLLTGSRQIGHNRESVEFPATCSSSSMVKSMISISGSTKMTSLSAAEEMVGDGSGTLFEVDACWTSLSAGVDVVGDGSGTWSFWEASWEWKSMLFAANEEKKWKISTSAVACTVTASTHFKNKCFAFVVFQNQLKFGERRKFSTV